MDTTSEDTQDERSQARQEPAPTADKDPTVTDHPAGETQAAENVENDFPDTSKLPAQPRPELGRPCARVTGVPAPQPMCGASHPSSVVISPSSAKRTTIMVLSFIVLLAIGTWAFKALSSFLFILMLAWLFSIAMEPPVLWLVKHRFRRGLATGVVMIVALLFALGVVALFGRVFLQQVGQLGDGLPSALKPVATWVNSTFNTSFDVNTLQLTPAKLGQLFGTYGGGLLGAAGSLVAVIFDGLITLALTYYLSADSPRLRQAIGSFLPPHYQRVFVTVWTISVEKTGGYVVSKVLLALLSGTFHVAFFWFIGVPYWLALGVLVGVVGQFIPTVGTYIGVALPALFTLLSGKPTNAVWIVVFATVYQQLENYVFTPRISHRTMDVHPAVALGSVVAGAALFGPVGALIGIPLAAAGFAIIETFRSRQQLLPELSSLEDTGNEQNHDAKETVERHAEARDRGISTLAIMTRAWTPPPPRPCRHGTAGRERASGGGEANPPAGAPSARPDRRGPNSESRRTGVRRGWMG